MNYKLFNPDHEIALAMNNKGFVASRNVRQMYTDLGYIPALWAEDGDVVIVEDVILAEQAFMELPLKHRPTVRFMTLKDAAAQIRQNDKINSAAHNYELCTMHSCLRSAQNYALIKPWGWNKALRETFMKAGVPVAILPSEKRLQEWRILSGRALAVKILEEQETVGSTVGRSKVCKATCEVEEFQGLYRNIVIKAPYSSSGRGVRFIGAEGIDDATHNWIGRTIKQQGYVTVEKKYDKLLDFAVEYELTTTGELRRMGLSLFQADGAAYTGNLLMGEDEKWDILTQYLPKDVIEYALQSLESSLTRHLSGKYSGVFGVDMMMTDYKYLHEHEIRINPCVEINLRRTMGHVALSLSKKDERGVMRITFNNGRFKLKIEEHENINLQENRTITT